jgi:hypothetical protein
MKQKDWFAIWVAITTTTALLGVIGIQFNWLDIQSNLLQYSQSSKFQALNVLGVMVTLLSGLLAVYGFYWVCVISIFNPLYKIIPCWLYFKIKKLGVLANKFAALAPIVYHFHRELLCSKVVIEKYSMALQKVNYGLEIVLVEDVKSALQKAIEKSFQPTDFEHQKLTTALNALLIGIGPTIELSELYRIQLLLLISIGYVPTTEEFDSAYQYIVAKHAFNSVICGDGVNKSEVLQILSTLEPIIPTKPYNFLISMKSGLHSGSTLYKFTKQSIGVQ